MHYPALKLDDYRLLPGRLRIAVPGMKQNKQMADYLAGCLRLSAGITSVTANPLTGRLLILFKSNQINLAMIQTAISKGVTTQGGRQALAGLQPPDARPCAGISMPQLLRSAPVLYTAATGAALAGLMIKRILVGRSSLSSSRHIFNLGAAVTIVAGYPLLRSGVKALAEKRRLNSDLLLFSATLILLTMRESLTGLTVLWLVYLSNLFQLVMQARTRQAIRKVIPCTPKSSGSISLSGYQTKLGDTGRITPLSEFYERRLLIGTAAISSVLYLLTRDMHRSVAVLLAGCPAAVALAATTARGAAVAAGLRRGILAKDARYFEMAAQVDTVVFAQTSQAVEERDLAPEIPAARKLEQLGVDTLVLATDENNGSIRLIPDWPGLTASREDSGLASTPAIIINSMRNNHRRTMLADSDANDAAALAASDIGVAMGVTGSAKALAAADIILTDSEPGKIADLIQIGRAAEKISRQNFLTATGLNVLGVTLAVLGIVTPLRASLLLNASTAAVVLNSMRLLSRLDNCSYIPPPAYARNLKLN